MGDTGGECGKGAKCHGGERGSMFLGRASEKSKVPRLQPCHSQVLSCHCPPLYLRQIKLHAHQYFLKLHASLGSDPPVLLPPTEAETVVAGGHINHHESLEEVDKAKVREGNSEKRDQEAILPLESQNEPQGEESHELMLRQGEQKECEHEGTQGNEDAKRQQEVQGAQQNINLVKICAESGIGALNDGKKTVNGENTAENTYLNQENFIGNPTTDGKGTRYPQ